MYSKKYILEKIEEFNGHNQTYGNKEGCICYLVYLNPGERGWFLCECMAEDEWMPYPHRIHTSTIQDVEYGEDHVVVVTKNTRFTFLEVKGSTKREGR